MEGMDDSVGGFVGYWWYWQGGGGGNVAGRVGQPVSVVVSDGRVCPCTFLKEGVQHGFKLVSHGITFIFGGSAVIGVERDI